MHEVKILYIKEKKYIHNSKLNGDEILITKKTKEKLNILNRLNLRTSANNFL